MPITRTEFDAGLSDEMKRWMKTIHKFLSADKDNAYNEEELRGRVRPQRTEEVQITFRSSLGTPPEPTEGQKPTVPVPSGPVKKEELKAFKAALRRLVDLGAAEAKHAEGLVYYIYRHDLATFE